MTTSKIAINFLGQTKFQLMQRINRMKNSNEIIHLEIGEPDFNTPENIKKALEAINKNLITMTLLD